jgi:lipopolysaccharide transport system permease protein
MIKKRQYLRLVIQKATSDLVAETRQGYIGLLWWVVEPVLYLSVFYLIFAVVFNRGGKEAVAFLLIGLVVWKWFGSSIPKCAHSIPANVGLIRQVYLPKVLLPCMAITTTSIKFSIVFLLLLVFLVVVGFNINLAWVYLPVLICIQFLFTLALGSVLAGIIPFFPDIRLILDNALLLLFFLSGIFFDFSDVSPDIKFYLDLNPMLGLIESYRSVLVRGVYPEWNDLAYLFFISVFLLLLGWFLLVRFDRVYPKIV